MTPFLQQVARHYFASGDIQDRIFVFPNRRSAAFFRSYLGDCVARSDAPLLAPRLVTINDFFSRALRQSASDRISLLLRLYDCYSALLRNPEPLDDFVGWGDVILADFDDIDKYRVDARGLFANIADLKSIRDDYSYADPAQLEALERLAGSFVGWKPSGLTDVKGNFLTIWQILFPLYTAFRARLREEGMAYEGMIYRDLAERLETEAARDLFSDVFPGVSGFVFVGLNALNSCEEAVLARLRDVGMAEFCWDDAGDFLQDGKNICSTFIRENVRKFPQAPRFCPQGGDAPPEVHFCEIPSSIGQARMLPDILQDIPAGERGIDCAVVLADETMMMPVLNSLPAGDEGINVTMGYPLPSSEWYAFMRDVLALQLHLKEKNGSWYFHNRQVRNILSSGILRARLDEAEREAANGIIRGAKYYVPQADFGSGVLLGLVFRPALTDASPGDDAARRTQCERLADYLMEVSAELAGRIREEDSLQAEFARQYYCCLSRLRDLSLPVLPRTWAHLLDQIAAGVSVPFDGEPLGGLQVMGPLETRALDFRHVIILNANEGVFPRVSVSRSFIPPELRKAFGLPTFERQDAVWAYYFYRMITRATDVWMLYDSRSEGLNPGEESRFVKQLQYLYRDRCRLHRSVSQSDISRTGQDDEIPKTAAHIGKMKTLRYSPSVIQEYMSCPVQFYYHKIEGLDAREEVNESLDAGMLGNVCHNTLRALYDGEEAMRRDDGFDKTRQHDKERYIDKTVTAEYLRGWLKRSDEIRRKVLSLIRAELRSVEVTGRDLVAADVAVEYVRRVIKADLDQLGERPSFQMLAMEIWREQSVCGHLFGGFVDRIDTLGTDGVRVVDYKTGSDRQEVLDPSGKAERLFSPSTAHRFKAALQFYLYDRMVEADFPDRTVSNAMYAMADLFTDPVRTWPQSEAFNAGVEAGLAAVFDEMENPEIPFRRVDRNQAACTYCDFKILCGRVSKDN